MLKYNRNFHSHQLSSLQQKQVYRYTEATPEIN